MVNNDFKKNIINIKIFLRSLLFSLAMSLSSIPLGIILVFVKFSFMKQKHLKLDIALTYWGKFVLWSLKHITLIDYKINGLEKLDKSKLYLMVSKHESTWEAFVMHTIMKPAPAFVMKKQLLTIPFFGWTLANATNIAIDRDTGSTSLKIIIKKSKEYLKEGHNIIIFPQGTRVPNNSTVEEYPYKIGFVVLAKELKVDVVPIALNSGKYWSKKQFLKYPGTIRMEVMDPIKYEDIKKMKNKEIFKTIETLIEDKSKELNNF